MSNNTNTWTVAAHSAGASIFEKRSPSDQYEEIQILDHPESRLRNRDLDSDGPGKTKDRVGFSKHAYTREKSSHEIRTNEFAHTLGALLNRALVDHKYGHLLLLGPPKFLGKLRAALSKEVTAMVTQSISLDWAGLSSNEMRLRLNAPGFGE